jgi:hypothetical protein
VKAIKSTKALRTDPLFTSQVRELLLQILDKPNEPHTILLLTEAIEIWPNME